MEWLGRAGLVARGVVYCLVAAIALRIATGHGGEADRRGALRTVAHQPLGRVLLVLLVIGFLGYAAWRFLKAAIGAREGAPDHGEAVNGLRRAGDALLGVLYLVVAGSTIKLLTGSNTVSEDQEQRVWTARLLHHAWGPWLVGAVGVVAIGVGVALFYWGLGQRFRETFDLGAMRRWRPMLLAIGVVGEPARGVVGVLIGAFLIQAAVTYDPHKAVGVDGALKRLADRSYGPWLLALVALGLLAFGLFSFVEARYRKVLE